jgi:putative endonuclease
MWYVYILKSTLDNTYYKGISQNYVRRLEEHNAGLSSYTSRKRPWILLHVETQPDKKSALIRERKLKKCKREYFEWLSKQPKNILNGEPPCHGPG